MIPLQPLNVYVRYIHEGDEVEWSFVKFSIHNLFLMSYQAWRVYFNLVYPAKAINAVNMSAYYDQVFECVFDFDFKLEDEVKYHGSRLAYLSKVMSSTNIPMMFLSTDVAVHRYFNVDNDSVYFLQKSESQESKFAKAYFNLGIYDAVYDDRVMIIPKSIVSGVLKDLDRIRNSFQYNETFINNICQYVIQTHAIVHGIPIKTLDPNDFIECSDSIGQYLSGKVSSIAGV